MLKCPNCGRKAEITKQWSCRWCGYPLVRRSFTKEKARREAEEAKRIRKEEIRAIKEGVRAKRKESARIMTAAKPKVAQPAKEVAGRPSLEAEQVIKPIAQQAEKGTVEKEATTVREAEKPIENQIAKSTPSPQSGLSETPSRSSDSSEQIQTADIIRVFIVDRDLFFSKGLDTYLSQSRDIEIVGKSDYFAEDTALLIKELAPTVVLVDINPPSCSGVDLARWIIARTPNIPVIVLAPYEDNEQMFETLKAGVAAYLSKYTSAKELAETIQKVYNGERIIENMLIRPPVAQRVLNQFQGVAKAAKDSAVSLSQQETEILSYFVNGLSGKQAALAMAIDDEAVKNLSVSIVSKLIASERRRKLLVK